ncbi:hypothetical protein PF003_g3019 [Phytophthora fragariae]|nr:hypothetical protein PF003_g3019 [Phytophthora fragariae]
MSRRPRLMMLTRAVGLCTTSSSKRSSVAPVAWLYTRSSTVPPIEACSQVR